MDCVCGDLSMPGIMRPVKVLSAKRSSGAGEFTIIGYHLAKHATRIHFVL